MNVGKRNFSLAFLGFPEYTDFSNVNTSSFRLTHLH